MYRPCVYTVVEPRGEVEQRIWDKIFNEFHDPFVRPIKKREDKLVVRVGITYHQLIDVVSQLNG